MSRIAMAFIVLQSSYAFHARPTIETVCSSSLAALTFGTAMLPMLLPESQVGITTIGLSDGQDFQDDFKALKNKMVQTLFPESAPAIQVAELNKTRNFETNFSKRNSTNNRPMTQICLTNRQAWLHQAGLHGL